MRQRVAASRTTNAWINCESGMGLVVEIEVPARLVTLLSFTVRVAGRFKDPNANAANRAALLLSSETMEMA